MAKVLHVNYFESHNKIYQANAKFDPGIFLFTYYETDNLPFNNVTRVDKKCKEACYATDEFIDVQGISEKSTGAFKFECRVIF